MGLTVIKIAAVPVPPVLVAVILKRVLEMAVVGVPVTMQAVDSVNPAGRSGEEAQAAGSPPP